MIYLVTGMGRCGTSLVMQMLKYGGADLGPVGSYGWPMFEDMRQTKVDAEEWIHEYEGCCLKWLGPDLWPPAPGHDYKAVWLDRDSKQQAKSQIKLQRTKNKKDWGKHEEKAMLGEMIRRRPLALRVLQRLGADILFMEFEDLIADCPGCAEEIDAHFGLGLDVEKMGLARVVGRKTTECIPDDKMLEDLLLTYGPRFE
jgi:hypothetical protein